ncbi:MAG: SUF system NifU family Fe-S cluster assembly protein [Armatimonadetes bacterium]|nr:SUF system NifU family Fe-S cluster assembly protein [Armatimonadota bacterium]
MIDLRELYQEVILDHYKEPRNFGDLPEATHRATGDNPLCGDNIIVTIRMEGEKVAEVRFTGSGCAISTASASLMTESIAGKTLDEVEMAFRDFHQLVTSEQEPAALGKLAAFAGVRDFPSRVKCATLAWHTLRAALEGARTVTTE